MYISTMFTFYIGQNKSIMLIYNFALFQQREDFQVHKRVLCVL